MLQNIDLLAQSEPEEEEGWGASEEFQEKRDVDTYRCREPSNRLDFLIAKTSLSIPFL